MSDVYSTEDKYFKRGMSISIAAHIIIVFLFMVKVIFFKTPILDLSQAIRVDMVGLPDKINHDHLPEKAQDRPLESQPEAHKKLTKLPDKISPAPKVNTSSINLKKVKNLQKEALEKLKALSAIDKIKNEVKVDELKNKIKQDAANAIAKGRVISAGTAITGLDKIEENSYLHHLDQQIKQHWALPQWLLNKPYKARVLLKFDSNGEIISRVIAQTSGQNAYDNFCLQAVDEAAPFPKVPEKFTEKFSIDGVIIGFPE